MMIIICAAEISAAARLGPSLPLRVGGKEEEDPFLAASEREPIYLEQTW